MAGKLVFSIDVTGEPHRDKSILPSDTACDCSIVMIL